MGARDRDQSAIVAGPSSNGDVRIAFNLVGSMLMLYHSPHGALHDVVRWVHRSAFSIRPSVPPPQGQVHSRSRAVRVPIPKVDGFYIDPGWYGTVVLESEGTHEGLADLQARCGPGVFPPRAEAFATKIRNQKEKENRRMWRILREKRYVLRFMCVMPD